MTAIHSTRRERLHDLVDGRPTLITDLVDVRYLSGFTGSNGWLVITGGSVVLVTDGRYVEQACAESDATVVEARTVDDMIAAVARVVSGPVSFQAGHVSFDLHRRLSTSGIELVPLDGRFGRLRRAKDSEEISIIERAVLIADRALAETCSLVDVGVSERDVRDELDHRMRRLGADGPSYDTIVASGPINSARPHHHPTARRMEEGDLVVVDVGALIDGYHSDMTRTFVVGSPSIEISERYDLVHEAQSKGVDSARVGVPCSQVDEVCRSVFRRHGFEDEFVHGTGHGVGLVIHEEPFLGRTSSSILEAGDVVTVEPGLYRVGVGGVRIEDLLVISDSATRTLSTFPKDLICLPSRPTI